MHLFMAYCTGDDLHRFGMSSPLSRGDMSVSGHNQPVPFEERLVREGGSKTVADREHQRGGALGTFVLGEMARL